jgi:asparagine synthase (glutamine-hydrolysing)
LLVSVDADSIERYRRHVSVFNDAERAELLDPDFRASLDQSRAPGVIANPWMAASGRSMLDRLLEVDVNTYLPEDLLVKVDIATMAHSLEARSPFLDPEVMEFAASLPPSEKVSLGRKKLLLRRAYRGVVPDSILDGAKQGFGVPLGAWFRGDLHGYAREVLLDRTTLNRGYLNKSAVRGILDAHAAGQGDRSPQLWALVMLESWHRALGARADRPPSDSVTQAPLGPIG